MSQRRWVDDSSSDEHISISSEEEDTPADVQVTNYKTKISILVSDTINVLFKAYRAVYKDFGKVVYTARHRI